MTTPTVNTFKHEANVVTFAAGKTIFNQGDPGNIMYIVQEGEVEIILHNQPIECVGAGGIIGEMALIDATSRSASAVAKTDCRLVPLDENRFKVYVHNTPFFAIQVMRVMASRLRHMDERL